MKKGSKAKAEAQRQAALRLLSSVPHQNTAAEVVPAEDGVVVSVPTRRPGWLIPPVSWILPWSGYRRVGLDAPGSAVLKLCDGRRNVEQIIETFAQEHKLGFRESQLAVMEFLRQLLRRGIIAIVGD